MVWLSFKNDSSTLQEVDPSSHRGMGPVVSVGTITTSLTTLIIGQQPTAPLLEQWVLGRNHHHLTINHQARFHELYTGDKLNDA